MCGLLYEYSNLEYERIYVIYRVTQAEYDIRVFIAASQEYVNTYSTRRATAHDTNDTTPYTQYIQRQVWGPYACRLSPLRTRRSLSHEESCGPAGARQTLARPGPRQTSTLPLMLTSARPPTRAWEVARTVVAPPVSVVKCLWKVFVWRSCRARVCAGVGGVFSVGVSCVRVTC